MYLYLRGRRNFRNIEAGRGWQDGDILRSRARLIERSKYVLIVVELGKIIESMIVELEDSEVGHIKRSVAT